MSQESDGLPKEIIEDLREAATRRAAGWRCFSLGFHEPTQDVLDDGYLVALDEAVNWTETGRERFRGGWDAMVEFHSSAGGKKDQATLLAELEAEYVRLFKGTEAGLTPPYESQYRERAADAESPLEPGSVVKAVRGFYQEGGWPSAPSPDEPPDHVATECEFMHYLCRQEADAWRNGDAAKAREYRLLEHRFLDEQLSRWLLDLCSDIQATSHSRFYWGLADFAGHYISLETGADFYVSFTPDDPSPR